MENMPMPMPEQGGEAAAPKQGGAREMISSIHEQMSRLMELVGGAQGVDDADKQALQGSLAQFEAFVDGLSGKPGAAPKGAAPMEAGAADVKPAM